MLRKETKSTRVRRNISLIVALKRGTKENLFSSPLPVAKLLLFTIHTNIFSNAYTKKNDCRQYSSRPGFLKRGVKKLMKKILQAKTMVVVALLMLLASCSSSRRSIAIEEGWELLGEEKVDFIRDKDEILVRSRSPFTAVQFKVEDKEVRLNYLKIHFQNGDKLEPNLNDIIGADQASPIIQISAEGRQIDKIEFKYRSVGKIFGSRANVLVLGKKFYRPEM